MKNVLHESITNIAYRFGKNEKKYTHKHNQVESELLEKKKVVMNVLCSKFVNMPN